MLALLFFSAATASVFGQAALDLFVSPTGSDASGDGSASNPFATPNRAFVAIGAYRTSNGGVCPAGGVSVNLAAGAYYLAETLTVTPETSCEAGNAFGVLVTGGDVSASSAPLISGGFLLPSGGWSALPGYPGLFSTTLPAGGAGNALGSRSLYTTGGQRRLLSRSPIMIADAVGQWGVAYAAGQVSPADAAAIDAPGASAEVVIMHNWVSSQNKIASVNATNSSIAPAGPAGDPFFNAGGNRWALQNVPNPASLSAGSFYYAFPAGAGGPATLVYAALPGEDPTDASSVQFVADHLPTVVALTGANASAPVVGVRLANVSLAHSAAVLEGGCMPSGCACQSNCDSLAALVHTQFAVDCALDSVQIFGAGTYAVWFDLGSIGCAITRSHLYDLGSGGVRIGDATDSGAPSTAPAQSSVVADCTIEQCGLIVPAGTGVFAQEAFNTTITHNAIHHLFYTGVAIGWTWGYAADSNGAEVVSYNDIHDIFQGVLSDGGCVYNLGRSPATQILNNICYNVNAFGYGG